MERDRASDILAFVGESVPVRTLCDVACDIVANRRWEKKLLRIDMSAERPWFQVGLQMIVT